MTLTLANGPLSTSPPDEANYRIDGPERRLLLTPFPRRVRAELGGTTVLDTTSGLLLHETGLLPVLYVPEADIAMEFLDATDRTTHCPFKGDASYWSIGTGDMVATNAVWSYPRPNLEARWLAGLFAFDFGRLDRWFDEGEEVFGHLRDPYHRVDVRRSSRGVRVTVGATVVTESTQPFTLSENGLGNRYYIPRGDVRMDLLSPSATTTYCPYKGRSTYWNLVLDDAGRNDVAWSYDDPLADAAPVAGCLSFDGTDVVVEPLDDPA